MSNHRILFFGTTAFGLPSLESLQRELPGSLVGIITQPAKPQGRKLTVIPTPVDAWAQARGIPVATPSTLKDPAALALIRSYQADTFLVAAYGLILPASALELPPLGSLNIHASLLPRHRGASPIAAAILAGDMTTGVTFMRMDEGIDTGPMLGSYLLPIDPTDTTGSLEKKLSELAGQHIVTELHSWWEHQRAAVQPSEGATYAGRIQKNDGRAHWNEAETLARKVRAYTPWPGLYSRWNGTPVKFLAAASRPDARTELPGSIVGIPDRPGWAVVCRQGLFVPSLVQFAGKKPQPAALIPGSYPNFVGSAFEA